MLEAGACCGEPLLDNEVAWFPVEVMRMEKEWREDVVLVVEVVVVLETGLQAAMLAAENAAYWPACGKSWQAYEAVPVVVEMSVLLWAVIDVSGMGMATRIALRLCS